MSFIDTSIDNGIATVKLNRGKVNALNETTVEQLIDCFHNLKDDESVKAIILTGQGKFFSFGFDIPEFRSYSKESFTDYIKKYSNLYSLIYLFPKPVIAAINGHCVAGGFILASVCDYRLMVTGKAKISLNEVTFGSTIFAGNLAILRELVGTRNAELIALRGRMYSAEEAKDLNLIDQIVSESELYSKAVYIADTYVQKHLPAYNSIKKLLRQPVYDNYKDLEEQSIKEFIEIWYSDYTREQTAEIKIRG
jgi:Delta3-Delta2-enoyl-CoA isomerase